MINIGLLGFGTVGQGVVEILNKHQAAFKQRTGKTIQVKSVLVRNLEKAKAHPLAGTVAITTNPGDILNDPDIHIVIEVLGGETPAKVFITQALEAKKHVITANKEVVSKHKSKFIALAVENQVDFYFEAAVGGSLPIIRSLKVGYGANEIQALYGILNGTTNFMLTKIEEDQKDYADVLKQAQDLGFAEADPTMDVSGKDAAYKLDILAAVAFKQEVGVDHIFHEGVDQLTLKDLKYAKEFGYKIKLLAQAYRTPAGLALKVHPTLINQDHPLASVRNEFNAVFVVGDAVGEAMIYGKGAGSLPTASAVVSDVLDVVLHNLAPSKQNLETLSAHLPLVPIGQTQSRFYLRMTIQDHPGVLEKIAHVFGQNTISISSLAQHEEPDTRAELVIITHSAAEAAFQTAVSTLKTLPDVTAIDAVIRVGLAL
ncbi:MAG: homoserine dehydrogenase [Candidatus Margulisiibacteriota bacterium]